MRKGLGGGSLRGKAKAFHKPCHTEHCEVSKNSCHTEAKPEVSQQFQNLQRDISVVSLPQYDKETNSPPLRRGI
ncbi:hypothetical protein [Campylobacter troglodytis]|uniref:hypothetical protein n=1 Tax=Campylobacter troglodytis TaxID=654363 RepID=UPI0011574A67|nr:hypothetical protein [Campylobacter troglodytis]